MKKAAEWINANECPKNTKGLKNNEASVIPIRCFLVGNNILYI